MHSRHEQRILFCRSEAERDEWVSALQRAAAVVPIEDDYVLGKELGRGRFSVVMECVHKRTGMRCAVKIIEKASLEPEEKQLLRTEIASKCFGYRTPINYPHSSQACESSKHYSNGGPLRKQNTYLYCNGEVEWRRTL